MDNDDVATFCVNYVDGSSLLADVPIKDRFTRLTLDLAAPHELAVTAFNVPHLEHNQNAHVMVNEISQGLSLRLLARPTQATTVPRLALSTQSTVQPPAGLSWRHQRELLAR